MTKVKFYKENDGQILAYFPEMEYYSKTSGFDQRMRSCYAHLGQHSSCHPDYLKGKKLANRMEYTDLLSELIGQGYDDLIVLNKDYKPQSSIRFSAIIVLLLGITLMSCYSTKNRACGSYSSWESHTKFRINR